MSKVKDALFCGYEFAMQNRMEPYTEGLYAGQRSQVNYATADVRRQLDLIASMTGAFHTTDMRRQLLDNLDNLENRVRAIIEAVAMEAVNG